MDYSSALFKEKQKLGPKNRPIPQAVLVIFIYESTGRPQSSRVRTHVGSLTHAE
jgi:hypothetical protein